MINTPESLKELAPKLTPKLASFCTVFVVAIDVVVVVWRIVASCRVGAIKDKL